MIRFFVLLSLCVFSLVVSPAYSVEKPNVLFIAVDDQNDWVNCMGGRNGVQTPNIDRLAKRGVLFTNAHCAAPSCHPSRVAMMTGVHPVNSGVYLNVHRKKWATWRLSPRLKNATTISEYFRLKGYHAVGGGKIYHALQWTKGSQNDPGTWDAYFPDARNPIPKQIRPHDLIPDHKTAIAPGRPLGGQYHLFGAKRIVTPDSNMSDYKVANWAISEINKPSKKPFFIAAGIFRPHIPWEVPGKYFRLYPLDKIKLPKVLKDDLVDTHGHNRTSWHKWVLSNPGMWKQLVQGYLASITFADAQVGRILDALDASPHAKNTIIVLWSDHGMHIGEKENWEKFTLWEEATRVPLIMVVPGVTQHGTVCRQPVSLVDVFPTLVDLTSEKIDGRMLEQLDGESLRPQLMNVDTERARPALTTYGYKNHALRSTRWRYIKYADGFEELYDHERDPDEFHNIAQNPDNRKIINELAKWLPKGEVEDLTPRQNQANPLSPR